MKTELFLVGALIAVSASAFADDIITGRLLKAANTYFEDGYEVLVSDHGVISKIYDLEMPGNICGKAIAIGRLGLNSSLDTIVTLEGGASESSVRDIEGVEHVAFVPQKRVDE